MHPESLRDHSLFQGPTASAKAEGYLFGALAVFAQLWAGATSSGPCIMCDEMCKLGLEIVKNHHDVDPTSSENTELNRCVTFFSGCLNEVEGYEDLTIEQEDLKELFVAFVKGQIELVAHLVPVVNILHVLVHTHCLNVSHLTDHIEWYKTGVSAQGAVPCYRLSVPWA